MQPIWKNARALHNAATDAERSRKRQVNGDRVLRFWNDDVRLKTEDVLEQIMRALTQPHANPPLQAGEGVGLPK